MLYFLFSFETGYNLNHLGVLGTLWLHENALLFPIMLALLVTSAFAGYLLGSYSTAISVSRKLYGDDIRDYGSGNAGFANMMRNFGKKASFLTLFGDAGKTVLAVLIGWVLYGYMGGITAGLFCFLGHIFPVFHHFRGGKGVVCLAATVLVLDWRLFLILFAVYVITLFVTKYSSFASVLMAMVMPIFMSRMYKIITVENARLKAYAIGATVIAVIIVIIKHWGNLRRIFEGTESKFEFKKSKEQTGDGDKND